MQANFISEGLFVIKKLVTKRKDPKLAEMTQQKVVLTLLLNLKTYL